MKIKFWNPGQTYIDVATRCLTALCDAAAFPAARRDEVIRIATDLLQPWGSAAIGRRPSSLSNISDEHFPIEFSLALEDGVSEVRMLWEAQTERFDMRHLWSEGWALSERIERDYGASMARLRQIGDLFAPSQASGFYALWHAVGFTPSGARRFKVYLDPQVRGADAAPELLTETLHRLGFGDSSRDLVKHTRHSDEFRFFSLDLSSSPDARVKLYKIHHEATRYDIEAWLRRVPGYSREVLDDFWRVIANSYGPFYRLPISSYVALNSKHAHPSTAAIHFPVRSYAENDLVVSKRVRRFLSGDDLKLYERALCAFATRPLKLGVGMQSYVSLRLHPGPRHVTIYLAPEAYVVEPAMEELSDDIMSLAAAQ